MGFDVHISVVFNCHDNEPVANLAKQYLDFLNIPKCDIDKWPEYDYSKHHKKLPFCWNQY